MMMVSMEAAYFELGAFVADVAEVVLMQVVFVLPMTVQEYLKSYWHLIQVS